MMHIIKINNNQTKKVNIKIFKIKKVIIYRAKVIKCNKFNLKLQ